MQRMELHGFLLVSCLSAPRVPSRVAPHVILTRHGDPQHGVDLSCPDHTRAVHQCWCCCCARCFVSPPPARPPGRGSRALGSIEACSPSLQQPHSDPTSLASLCLFFVRSWAATTGWGGTPSLHGSALLRCSSSSLKQGSNTAGVCPMPFSFVVIVVLWRQNECR